MLATTLRPLSSGELVSKYETHTIPSIARTSKSDNIVSTTSFYGLRPLIDAVLVSVH